MARRIGNTAGSLEDFISRRHTVVSDLSSAPSSDKDLLTILKDTMPRQTIAAAYDANTAVFLYGSLTSTDVLSTALCLAPDDDSFPSPYIDAQLPGYTRFKVRGSSFPAVVRDEGGMVCGKIVYLKNEAQMVALDRMEETLYKRAEEQVLVDGVLGAAYVYVWRGATEDLVKEHPALPQE